MTESLKKLVKEDFNYELPDKQVAHYPLEDRSQSKLLIYKENENIRNSHVAQIADEFPHGALFIVNDTRVLPSRLYGQTEHGGKVELFLIENIPGLKKAKWKAIGRPMKKFKVGTTLYFSEGISATIVDKKDGSPPTVEVEFNCERDELFGWMEKEGYIPLPPYIKRAKEQKAVESDDKEKYQTVYAKVNGSVAAPTAGLHFTDEVIESMKEANIEFAPVTLHVGAGTFLPVKNNDIDSHHMHSEHYYITEETISKIEKANRENIPVICVGTTSFRAVQSFAKLTKDKNWKEYTNKWIATNLFIYPENEDFRYKPWGVNGLMTNFHQPESTLIMLISALVGYKNMKKIYSHAIDSDYRFFSYGDSSLLWLD